MTIFLESINYEKYLYFKIADIVLKFSCISLILEK